MAGTDFSTVYLLDRSGRVLASNTSKPSARRSGGNTKYIHEHLSIPVYRLDNSQHHYEIGQVFGFVSTVLYSLFLYLCLPSCVECLIIYVSQAKLSADRIDHAPDRTRTGDKRDGKTVPGAGKDELDFIVSAIDAMIEDSNRYMEEYETNRLIQRAHFFREQMMPTRQLEQGRSGGRKCEARFAVGVCLLAHGGAGD